MPGPAFLRGDTVTLHPIEPEDADVLAAILDDPEVWPTLATSTPTSRVEERKCIEELRECDGTHLLIRVDDETVGTVGLNDPEPVWGHAELGYFVRPDAQGNGYATDAVRRICRYAFDHRRLHKLFANAFETNPASHRVLEKVGFAHEGTFREHAYVGGEYRDVERYGIIDGEISASSDE